MKANQFLKASLGVDDGQEENVQAATSQDFQAPAVRFDAGPGKWLRWLMAIVGCGLLMATIAVFLPVKVMATVHGWLGLGQFPDEPITVYLARSTSMLYAVHGFMMLFVSFDLKRYWPLVAVFGWLHIVMGLTMFLIDLTTPMPMFWIVGEGIPIAIAGQVIISLWRRANLAQENTVS